ncbi:GntR family transcriptional regulator [Actinacidiphila sp. DG2A-62]|uniref:GntR family transcriptional regulator n=1 Tax=Actinacidiphila sp. DG2A-62 TaxID=3108821 RepID=UPI002DB8119C|nr:GntR family transcriptional regulator [Actinacidiphila sp. DG2A-62]MEC3995568.1 GntR family transcriptional regulator [Actinacidiphila sp. DG2A-62]
MSARHQQVADDLRRRIVSGALTTGERLPSERQLSAHYRVSTPTLRDALGVLQAEGLVEKVQGRGNFVREPAPRLTYPGRHPGAAEVADLHVVSSFSEVAAAGEVAARLGVPPDTTVTRYVCLAHRGDTPHSLTHLYVPHAAHELEPPSVPLSPWGDDLLEQFADRAAGPAARATHQVTARFPTDAEAQSLRIAVRTPVLAIERRVVAERSEPDTQEARVLAYALVVLPGDRARIAFATRHPDPDHHCEPDQKGAAR